MRRVRSLRRQVRPECHYTGRDRYYKQRHLHRVRQMCRRVSDRSAVVEVNVFERRKCLCVADRDKEQEEGAPAGTVVRAEDTAEDRAATLPARAESACAPRAERPRLMSVEFHACRKHALDAGPR